MQGLVVIDQRGATLEETGDKLIVRMDGERIATVPLKTIDRLIVSASCHLQSGLLEKLARQGSGVLIASQRPFAARPVTLLEAKSDAARRRAQHLAATSTLGLVFATGFIRAKLAGQAALLRARAADSPDARKPLFDAAQRISSALETLDASATSIESLRGIEGAAAAAFFGGFRALFAPSLEFSGRNRRPPRDPVNVCLSLCYTLGQHESLSAIARSGLDPACGFLHEPFAGRDSLACDLNEPLRPLCERFTASVFRRDALRPEHFTANDSGCIMGKAGRKIFYEHAASELLPELERTARHLARTLATKLDELVTPDLPPAPIAASQEGHEP